MQFTTTIIISTIAALPAALAGQATVNNLCPKPICVYETQPGGGSITNTYTLQPDGAVNIPYPANGAVGTQVRISPTCDPNYIVYWEFAQGDDIIYYDVNENVGENPFHVRGLGVTTSNTTCPIISCQPDSTACFNNPNGNPQNQVKACSSEYDIYFNGCRPSPIYQV